MISNNREAMVCWPTHFSSDRCADVLPIFWPIAAPLKTFFGIYINAYLRSLPVLVETFDALQDTNDADDVLITKSALTFDDYNAMGGMEVYVGQPAPPNHDSSYDATKTVRGNVTGTTQWIDLATNNSITRLRKLDKFGNTVKEQVSCCNERSYTCDETNCQGSRSREQERLTKS
jgi:hypothetical protein